MNNAYVLNAIGGSDDSDDTRAAHPAPIPRARLDTGVCLPLRLPPQAVLLREALQSVEMEELRQLRRSPSPSSSGMDETEDTVLDNVPAPPPEQPLQTTDARSSMERLKRKLSLSSTNSTVPWRQPAPFEVFRAIENKDITLLMQIRDHAFHLLLRKTGHTTPLVHAMRIGDSHRDIAILLLGAFSRWVNHLENEDFEIHQTRILLKALRANLKLAIDYGLQRSQSDLLASFLQTLVMSEGDKWIASACSTVSLALKAGVEGKPVKTAGDLVRTFATKELGKAETIATLEDYIANATADLIIMGLWSNILDKISGDPIPSYLFARDNRVFKEFQERLQLASDQQTRFTRRLKWQIRVVDKLFVRREIGHKRKVELLCQEFDIGPGV